MIAGRGGGQTRFAIRSGLRAMSSVSPPPIRIAGLNDQGGGVSRGSSLRLAFNLLAD
jgi:hypothetical protein